MRRQRPRAACKRGAIKGGTPSWTDVVSLSTAGTAAAATGLIAAPAIAQSMPALQWRLTSSYPKTLDTIFGAAELFANYVAEATDNKFKIQALRRQ